MKRQNPYLDPRKPGLTASQLHYPYLKNHCHKCNRESKTPYCRSDFQFQVKRALDNPDSRYLCKHCACIWSINSGVDRSLRTRTILSQQCPNCDSKAHPVTDDNVQYILEKFYGDSPIEVKERLPFEPLAVTTPELMVKQMISDVQAYRTLLVQLQRKYNALEVNLNTVHSNIPGERQFLVDIADSLEEIITKQLTVPEIRAIVGTVIKKLKA